MQKAQRLRQIEQCVDALVLRTRRWQYWKDSQGRPRDLHCLQTAADPVFWTETFSWHPREMYIQGARERFVRRLLVLAEVRAKQLLHIPLKPGMVRPSHAGDEQGKHSVRHKEHTVSEADCRTLVHVAVLQNLGGTGGLHTRQRPSLLVGARNAQEGERQGFSPEAQRIYKDAANAGSLHFSVEQEGDDTDVMLKAVMPGSRIVSAEEPGDGRHKEQ